MKNSNEIKGITTKHPTKINKQTNERTHTQINEYNGSNKNNHHIFLCVSLEKT